MPIITNSYYYFHIIEPICGRCNRLCLMLPEGAQCACPNGDAFLNPEFTHCSGSMSLNLISKLVVK